MSVVGPQTVGALFGAPVEFYHLDVLGSVRMITNSAGAVVTRRDYLAFGEENELVTQDHRGFTGKELDAETALQYFGARYYRNVAGRFTTIDPGQASGSPQDPQGWNAYAYARNNPLRFVDTTGLAYEVVLYEGWNTFTVGTDEFNTWLRYPSLNPGLRIFTNSGKENSDGWIYSSSGAVLGYFRWTPDEKKDPYTLNYALEDAGNRARVGVNAALVVASPNFAIASVAYGSAIGAGRAVTALGRIVAGPTPGQTAAIARTAAQGGRKSVEKALRSFESRLARHLADLDRYRQAGGYTSTTESEIANFRGLIQAARNWLSKRQ